jgi:hypothetical protein
MRVHYHHDEGRCALERYGKLQVELDAAKAEWVGANMHIQYLMDQVDTEREKVRVLHLQTIGWMYAYACNCADRGVDIRKIELPLIADQCSAALAATEEQP